MKQYIITTLVDDVLHCFCLVGCHCVAINVSVQKYNGVLFPDIVLLIDPMLLPSGNPFKCHEEVLYLQPMIPPKRFDIFPLTGGCSEGLGAFNFFFKNLSPSTRVFPQKDRYEIFDGKIFARKSCRKI